MSENNELHKKFQEQEFGIYLRYRQKKLGLFIKAHEDRIANLRLKSSKSIISYKGLYLDSPSDAMLFDIFNLNEVIKSFPVSSSLSSIVTLFQKKSLKKGITRLNSGIKISQKFTQLVHFINENNFNAITIYFDIETIIKLNADKREQFLEFIEALKNSIKDLKIILVFNNIENFNILYQYFNLNDNSYFIRYSSLPALEKLSQSLPNPGEQVLRIDGFNFEFEFWRGDKYGTTDTERVNAFNTWNDVNINIHNTLGINNPKFTYESYIYGFTNPNVDDFRAYDQAVAAVTNLDRILVTAYKAYNYDKWVLQALIDPASYNKDEFIKRLFHSAVETLSYIALASHNLNKPIDVVIIFDAQGPFYEDGIKYSYLGPWLAKDGTTFPGGEYVEKTSFKFADFDEVWNLFLVVYDDWLQRPNLIKYPDTEYISENILYNGNPNYQITERIIDPVTKEPIGGDKNKINLIGCQWFAYTDLYYAAVSKKP